VIIHIYDTYRQAYYSYNVRTIRGMWCWYAESESRDDTRSAPAVKHPICLLRNFTHARFLTWVVVGRTILLSMHTW
jgi:hypothetical protein